MTITTVKFNDKITFKSMARTLTPYDLGHQDSGWTIEGIVYEDYFEWVNYFEASHPDFGWVKGDYEIELTGKSKKALEHFMSNHPAYEWDYYDI